MKLKITIKRIFFIGVLIAISVISAEITKNNSLSSKAVQANSTPITNKKVVLDAGHRTS